VISNDDADHRATPFPSNVAPPSGFLQRSFPAIFAGLTPLMVIEPRYRRVAGPPIFSEASEETVPADEPSVTFVLKSRVCHQTRAKATSAQGGVIGKMERRHEGEEVARMDDAVVHLHREREVSRTVEVADEAFHRMRVCSISRSSG